MVSSSSWWPKSAQYALNKIQACKNWPWILIILVWNRHFDWNMAMLCIWQKSQSCTELDDIGEVRWILWFLMDTLTTSLWATWSSGRPLDTLERAQGKGQVDAWQTEKSAAWSTDFCYSTICFAWHLVSNALSGKMCYGISHRWGSCLIHGRCELWWQISWDTISVSAHFGGHTKSDRQKWRCIWCIVMISYDFFEGFFLVSLSVNDRSLQDATLVFCWRGACTSSMTQL